MFPKFRFSDQRKTPQWKQTLDLTIRGALSAPKRQDKAPKRQLYLDFRLISFHAENKVDNMKQPNSEQNCTGDIDFFQKHHCKSDRH